MQRSAFAHRVTSKMSCIRQKCVAKLPAISVHVQLFSASMSMPSLASQQSPFSWNLMMMGMTPRSSLSAKTLLSCAGVSTCCIFCYAEKVSCGGSNERKFHITYLTLRAWIWLRLRLAHDLQSFASGWLNESSPQDSQQDPAANKQTQSCSFQQVKMMWGLTCPKYSNTKQCSVRALCISALMCTCLGGVHRA